MDPSNYVVSYVLVQNNHPVAFESGILNLMEQRYSTHEKRMVVVFHCLQAWRVYLLGTKFVVKMISVTNTYFKTQ